MEKTGIVKDHGKKSLNIRRFNEKYYLDLNFLDFKFNLNLNLNKIHKRVNKDLSMEISGKQNMVNSTSVYNKLLLLLLILNILTGYHKTVNSHLN